MAKFLYKFRTVKKIKEILEKQAQKELAETQAKIDLVFLEIEQVKELKAKSKADKEKSGKIKISDLQFMENFTSSLDDTIKALYQEVDNLNKVKEQKIQKLIERAKDSKVFQKLEEKYKEEFLIELNRLEQKEMDEIALRKFSKGD
ncbi:MAG TPA: flagellar export protein FliJ [Ignavibacteriales bacterium]|nr:flagellar export protein FliJ [Ignavibacteriales bacterium]